MKIIQIATNPNNKSQTIVFGGEHCNELGIDRLVGQRLFLTAHVPALTEKWASQGFTVEVVGTTTEVTCGLSVVAPATN